MTLILKKLFRKTNFPLKKHFPFEENSPTKLENPLPPISALSHVACMHSPARLTQNFDGGSFFHRLYALLERDRILGVTAVRPPIVVFRCRESQITFRFRRPVGLRTKPPTIVDVNGNNKIPPPPPPPLPKCRQLYLAPYFDACLRYKVRHKNIRAIAWNIKYR